ncbi:MAG: UDP-glucose 4-epimerase GalE [Flavobacteriaceae bacterium]|nr:UDP-glucose 4-epimerase GalE [Flavobacteriaceae bacterium]NNK59895.1 UDP-glucose 4-epimerase GalE [Flavobacteriaceae bacterium]
MPKVLVTGGLGYIGSHTVVELLEQGFEVSIIDDLSNSSLDILDRIESITEIRPAFDEIDLKDKAKVLAFFKSNNDLTGVIHFAASKAVGESVDKPLHYYENNINTLIHILNALKNCRQQNFIFSSSCTVYGQADTLPISETAPVKAAESPYGNTKQVGEEILKDLSQIDENFKTILLRYFNPIGAHKSAKIGELPIGVPQNLVPFITQTAIGIRDQLSVFGNDYPTPDGTCIRDYIHVVDLAKAHVVALNRLLNKANNSNYEIFNLGTGKGSSVLEVVKSFERVSGQSLNYRIAPRRQGDIISAYADTTKANNELGWRAKYSLDDALKSAWLWEQEIRKNS